MNMNKIAILIVAASSLLFLNSCGKTDLDLEYEEFLLGDWVPYNLDNERLTTLPLYHFGGNTRGTTRQQGQANLDSLSWEVKRGQLKVFYDRAPTGYFVAYDQYYSRSLYRIHEATQDRIRLTLFLYNGFQREFLLLRPESDDPDYIDDYF